MFKKFKILYLIVILLGNNLLNDVAAIEEQDFIDHKLDIFLSSKNDIKIKEIKDDQIIKATLLGKIESPKNAAFNNAEIECDLIGRSYQGRSFSCGFSEVEDLNGFCEITFKDKNSIILIDWKCSTTAGLQGDAVCKGKLDVLKGFGDYAGVIGFGKLEMPLIKTIKSEKISLPMKVQISLKRPLLLKSKF